MEQEVLAVRQEYKNMFFQIAITQLVAVAVLILSVLIIQLVNNSTYKKIRDWCILNIFDETNIEEVFEEEINDEI